MSTIPKQLNSFCHKDLLADNKAIATYFPYEPVTLHIFSVIPIETNKKQNKEK